MSLICAVPHECGQLIATDRRHSIIAHSNNTRVSYSDHGAKLIRVDASTWVTFGGPWSHIAPVVEEVRAVRSHDDAWEVLKRASASLPATPHTSFLIAGPKGVGRVSHNVVKEPSHDLVSVVHPPDQDNTAVIAEIRSLFAELEAETIRTAGDLVRRIAQMFARIADPTSPFVSPTMELAIGTRYLAGPAEGIAAMADRELSAAATTVYAPIEAVIPFASL
jgi:hypothetical protein